VPSSVYKINMESQTVTEKQLMICIFRSQWMKKWLISNPMMLIQSDKEQVNKVSYTIVFFSRYAEFQHPCKDRNDSHTHWHDAQSDSFIIPLVRLYTFYISVHAIMLIRIGYKNKSCTVHTPHIPLWLVTMHYRQ